MDYTDLQNKTIYDFCDDEIILKQINICLDKDEYIRRTKNMPLYTRGFALYDLSQLTGDKELKKAVVEQFGDAMDVFFNE
jgi:hypothetical protein